MATFRIRPGLRKSDPNPNSSRSLAVRRGARRRGRRKTISCCLSRRFSANHRSHATGATQRRGHDGPVKQGQQEVLHARDSVGQTSGDTQRDLNPRFSERMGNSRRTGAGRLCAEQNFARSAALGCRKVPSRASKSEIPVLGLTCAPLRHGLQWLPFLPTLAYLLSFDRE